MNRTEFIGKFGIGLALICAGSCLDACKKEENQAVDFTLDLSLPENKALQNAGGSVVHQKVIVARVDANTFTAVSLACTHQGTAVTYQSANKRFNCPNHGSNFDINGKVINGPASSSLSHYSTTLSGNSLRVFSA